MASAPAGGFDPELSNLTHDRMESAIGSPDDAPKAPVFMFRIRLSIGELRE
jgi:hypothetical protein